MSDFQKGTKVTICSDAECKHPRRIGIVKRIGNGAWRLGGCSEWYDSEGKRVAVMTEGDDGDFAAYATTTCFARPYQEGDEAAILVEDERVKKYKDLADGKAAYERRIRYDFNLNEAERRINYAALQVKEAEQHLKFRKGDLERAVTNRDKLAETVIEYKGKIALIEAELAKFGTEW